MAANLKLAMFFIAFIAGSWMGNLNAPHYYNIRGYSAYSRVTVRNLLPWRLRLAKFSFRPISIWHKRGHISLLHPFPPDLTTSMDVGWNPGPDNLDHCPVRRNYIDDAGPGKRSRKD
ncbi:predicted protein [Nematostella vectensis]|uniref:Uncharacterized protein n=1 Tax=Nematostella vectensis TaxID=45351 RepID=A7SEM0_NEMVE|nr:predicted protein [Nematostella vectensis]|eukprot:XP_001629875.1 predicted protein [Nematostella vectensis]